TLFRSYFYDYNDPFTGCSSPCSGNFHYIWDQNYDSEFRNLLAAFQARYSTNPQIAFMYVPGAWSWDEYQGWADNRPAGVGITPALYISRFQNLMSSYASAL